MNTIHNLNTLRFVSGLEAERVWSEYGTFATEVEVEDWIVATVRYRNGALGTIESGSINRGRDPAKPTGDRIYGTEGQILLSNPPQIFTRLGTAEIPAHQWYTLPAEAGGLEQRTRAVDGFAAAVLAGKEPPVTGADGRAALAIVEAAYHSGQRGEPVRVK
jgi:predicted dehydrogenase